jgi:hypothetical protein
MVNESFGKDHRRGVDRSCQGPPAGLVHTGYAHIALFPQTSLRIAESPPACLTPTGFVVLLPGAFSEFPRADARISFEGADES